LIINKKSIIDLKMLLLINNRLQAIRPQAADQLFRGINMLLCGDFFQLPPVDRQPLFASQAKHVDTIKSSYLYQAFDQTIRLQEVMRQQGNDDILTKF
jgi:ATP-dependent DNA helicase PIF1